MNAPSFLEKHPHIARSIWRRIHIPVNSSLFSTIHVNEYPKSGGTWTCRLLRDCLSWRFDDNVFPMFGNSIIKHHRIGYFPKNTLCVVRDPRDVAVSYFHHSKAIFDKDPFNVGNVKLNSKYIFKDIEDEQEQLNRFVEVIAARPISPNFTWGGFYQSVPSNIAKVVRYEDLRESTVDVLLDIFVSFGLEMERSVVERVVESHDIGKIIKNRSPEEKNSFIRKGSLGGWKNELSSESVKKIELDAGELLAKFGYK